MDGYLCLHIEDCPGCDHWADYDFIGLGEYSITFRCPSCKTVKALTYHDLEDILRESLRNLKSIGEKKTS